MIWAREKNAALSTRGFTEAMEKPLRIMRGLFMPLWERRYLWR